MNQTTDPSIKVRVANFANLNLPSEHLLKFDSENTAVLVDKVRRYADLPYIYVIEQKKAAQVAELLSALKAIRSPCFPHALVLLNGANVDIGEEDLDVVKIDSLDPETIQTSIDEYASKRFVFDELRLLPSNSNPLPKKVDVAVIGAGITGLYAASRLQEAGISFAVIEKEDLVGGIWSLYANATSQVNTSESAYRLVEKKARSNCDHSPTREILEDIAHLADNVSDRIYTETEVYNISTRENGYQIHLNRQGEAFVLESNGVVLAVNDRVGTPREVLWSNQPEFKGKIVNGISNHAQGLDWRDKKVVIVGMGAFAIENTRTALVGGARHVTVVGRRHGTVCPKIIDYLNFATPYDEDYQHDKKSNLKNMMYWKKLYDLSGATQPECWMGKIKHEGHTISVSDIWFVGHYLKKIKTITGEISSMNANGVIVDGQIPIDADVVVNCVGFERNTSSARRLSGYHETYNNNYLAKDFMYLADAYIDSDAFNSLFGSSVLEMVKFYIEVFILFFNNPEYDTMMRTEGIEKIPVEDRQWSNYIKAAMALIRSDARIAEIADKQIKQRTNNFLEVHDLETYIAENKREWIDMHSSLAGREMREADCLPYVFDKLLTN